MPDPCRVWRGDYVYELCAIAGGFQCTQDVEIERVSRSTSLADFDVLIAGGGMIGACCAAALAAQPWRIGLLDARAAAMEWPPDTADLRVSAISRATESIFRNLNVWSAMERSGVSPFRNMHVWDSAGSGEIHFDAAHIGEAHLGHIVENRIIQRALWQALEKAANVSLVVPAVVAHFRQDDDAALVELEDGRRLRAKLLVAADGTDSLIRQLANISIVGWGYDQCGVVANVSTEYPHRETAWQRFLLQGPLAFLPMRDGGCSIVWSTTSDHAGELLRMSDEQFCAVLTEGFGARLGKVVRTGPRAAFPLRLQHVQQYVQPRLALIGDAAHTIHPLAGQGANLGFLDAAALAQALAGCSDDPGRISCLRRYERQRKGDNVAMMAVMDGFKRLFGARAAPVTWLRNAGLALTDRAHPVKDFIMRRAMGLEGDLPALARVTQTASSAFYRETPPR